jgi:zinc protease
VRAGQGGATFSGTFTITVTLRKDADMAQVKKIVLDEVAKVTHEDLGAKELARVVAEQESSKIFSLESILSRANTLQAYNQDLGDPDRISWDLDRYRKATPDKIRAIAAKYLAPDHVITVITNPMKGGGK